MRLVVVAGLFCALSSCTAVNTSDSEPGRASASLERLLDALLSDLLTNPRFADDREFYGTAGGREIVLVNEDQSVPWPESYAPKTLCGWRLIAMSQHRRPVAGEGGKTDRKLGIRMDMICLNPAILNPDGEPSHGPITLTVFNVGGTKGGVQPIGGTTFWYSANFKDGKWIVKYRGGRS